MSAKIILSCIPAICFCLSLVACSFGDDVSRDTSYMSKRSTKAYTVNGQTWQPLDSAKNFREEGIASWYGPGFHGKKTASGERFNQYAMTAAHKILPLGSKVRVTNLANNRSVIVVINDRGPFAHNRIIDLSKGAAEKLDLVKSGSGRVLIQSLE